MLNILLRLPNDTKCPEAAGRQPRATGCLKGPSQEALHWAARAPPPSSPPSQGMMSPLSPHHSGSNSRSVLRPQPSSSQTRRRGTARGLGSAKSCSQHSPGSSPNFAAGRAEDWGRGRPGASGRGRRGSPRLPRAGDPRGAGGRGRDHGAALSPRAGELQRARTHGRCSGSSATAGPGGGGGGGGGGDCG